MQLAKIRRKTQPVKNFFYEIWKIAVDLGEFGARRPGRCGARAVGADARRGARWGARGGRWAARPGAVRPGAVRRECWAAGRGCEATGRVAAARTRRAARGGEAGRALPGTSAARARRAGLRDGHGAGVGQRAACGVWRRRAGRRGGEQNHASSPRPSDEPPKARSFSHPDGISDESDAFWAFIRFAAAQFDQSQAKSPSPAPNPVHSHPFCRIAECGSDLDEGGEQRRSNRREDDDTRERGRRYARAGATIREGGGDDTREQERCTRAGAMRGSNTTKRQLKDGTQLQSLWSDRRTRPESPKPRGEGLSPIGTIRFGGV